LLFQISTHNPHILKQVFFLDGLLNRQRSRTSDGVALVRLSMSKNARTLVHRLHDLLADQETRNRGVPSSETLTDSLEVGNNALVFPCVQGATPTHAAHHFVKNEKRAVLLANGFHGWEIAWNGGDGAEGL
jgi:hypothetical protein